MSLRTEIRAAVLEDRLEDIEQVVAGNARAVRHLMSLTYDLDTEIRDRAAKGIGLAARHHTDLGEQVVRRQIWAMNDESGTNAATAPFVLQAIARVRPELVLPVVPDIVRLSNDPGLHDDLADVLCIVVHALPGQVGHKMTASINERIEKGECCG